MDELTLGDETYISTKRAASITGYAKDYVGQLCREGRVQAKLVGRSWYVLEASIRDHRFGVEGQESGVSATGMVGERVLHAIEPTLEAVEEPVWDSPTYEVEVAEPIPEIVRPSPSIVHAEERIEPVSEMQNAWKSWFEQRPAEPINAMEEQPEEDIKEYTAKILEKSVEPAPVLPEREEQRPRFEAEPVPIARKHVAYDIYPVRPEEVVEEKPARIIAERIRKPAALNSRILKSLFIGVIVIAVATTIVASGSVSVVGGTAIQNSPIIEILEGKSVLQK